MGDDTQLGLWRLSLAVGALVLLWIAVYWWTPAPAEVSVRLEPADVQQDLPAAQEQVVPAPAGPIVAVPADSRPPAAAEAPAPKLSVLPPTFIRHTVIAGDTAETISKRYLGTAQHWRAVMRANPKTDFQHLRAGMIIKVPTDPSNIQGKRVAAEEAKPRENAPRPAPKSTEPAAPGAEYVVAKGDTLTGLAVRFYGRASDWTLIRDANRVDLGDKGERLREGMRIVIPPPRPR